MRAQSPKPNQRFPGNGKPWSVRLCLTAIRRGAEVSLGDRVPGPALGGMRTGTSAPNDEARMPSREAPVTQTQRGYPLGRPDRAAGRAATPRRYSDGLNIRSRCD